MDRALGDDISALEGLDLRLLGLTSPGAVSDLSGLGEDEIRRRIAAVKGEV